MEFIEVFNESIKLESNYQLAERLASELSEVMVGTSYGGVVVGNGAKLTDLLRSEWYLELILDTVNSDIKINLDRLLEEPEFLVTVDPLSTIQDIVEELSCSEGVADRGSVVSYRVNCLVEVKNNTDSDPELFIDSELLLVFVVSDVNLDYSGLLNLPDTEPSALDLLGIKSLTSRVALSEGIH